MNEQDMLLDAILAEQANSDGDDNALTVKEMSAKLGWGDAKVRKYIKALMADNKIEAVWVYRNNISTSLTGHRDKRPGYMVAS